jgi:UDP-N-acetylglucosamine--N-acetylmuramyl-(pentapeptide) pyrophosphoryl-undecaprenol N-acetylglucosamine transferase
VRVLIAGGGTAGHVFPALAVAHALVRDHDAEVRFAGTPDGQEARLVPAEGFEFEPVEAAPFARKVSVRSATAPLVALRSMRRARPLVEDADVVLGMGGYASVPVGVAAIRARRPLVLHEQNAVPGLANRLLARPARAFALSFAEAARYLPRRVRSVLTGDPVRAAIAAVPQGRTELAQEALEELDLEPDRRTVVVFGGSLGARRINRAAAEAFRELGDRDDVQFLILTGPAHLELVRGAIPPGIRPRVRALAFLERMELAYALADLVVCRAGANSVAELAVCGLPSVLVPYPYATARHQDANARALQRAGAAAVVLDEALTGPLLASRIRELLGDAGRLRQMGERASAWGRPDAAGALARVVAEAAS